MLKMKRNEKGEYQITDANNTTFVIFKKDENDGFGTWRLCVLDSQGDYHWMEDFDRLWEAKGFLSETMIWTKEA